jgi:hypothetical protein
LFQIGRKGRFADNQKFLKSSSIGMSLPRFAAVVMAGATGACPLPFLLPLAGGAWRFADGMAA